MFVLSTNEEDAETIRLCVKYSQAEGLPPTVTGYVNASSPHYGESDHAL